MHSRNHLSSLFPDGCMTFFPYFFTKSNPISIVNVFHEVRFFGMIRIRINLMIHDQNHSEWNHGVFTKEPINPLRAPIDQFL